MSLIVTPGQLTRRAELYQQLGQLAAAGLGLVQALEQLQRHPPARSFRAPLQALLDGIAQGLTFAEAAQRMNGWLPAFDLALLEAGERSGRLDVCFRALASFYNERARLIKQMIGQLIYPVGLIHFAAFVFLIVLPFAAAGMNFDAGLVWLFVRAALILAPLYLGTALLVYVLQSKHGEAWRGFVEQFLHPIPILGRARRELALARLAMALEALLSAGVDIIEAWELAAAVSGSPALRRTVREWRAAVRAGQTPAEAVTASGRFPDLFSNQYATGEVSGKLDEVLRRLHHYYEEEGARKMHALAQWLPRGVYLCVALFIGYRVISYYAGYMQQIQNITNGF